MVRPALVQLAEGVVGEPEVRLLVEMPVVRVAGAAGPLMEELARLGLPVTVLALPGLLSVAVAAAHIVKVAGRALAVTALVVKS
jgi:hypothetical protein